MGTPALVLTEEYEGVMEIARVKVRLPMRSKRQYATTITNYTGLRLRRHKICQPASNSLFDDVVTIKRALSHSRRQGYLKHF